jgi:hypothetical protein
VYPSSCAATDMLPISQTRTKVSRHSSAYAEVAFQVRR